YLIDDAGALADQAFAHPMESLQVELFGGLSRHKFHRGALDRLSDCLRVAEVVLLSLRVGAHVLGRHQPCVMTERPELATEVMRTDTALHPNQTRRHVRQPGFYLATRPLLAQRSHRAHLGR